MSRLGTKHRPHVPPTTTEYYFTRRERMRRQVHAEQQVKPAIEIATPGQLGSMLKTGGFNLGRLARAGRRRV